MIGLLLLGYWLGSPTVVIKTKGKEEKKLPKEKTLLWNEQEPYKSENEMEYIF